ncbi:MAG: hypothetical protein ACRYFA_14815 [Janthinobacterium lividum]
MNTLKSVIVLFLLCQAFNASAQNDDQQPYLNKSFANANIKHVNVKTSGGSINIVGSNAADAHVEVYVNTNNGNGETISKEEITQRMQDYNLDVSLSGTELEVSAKAKNSNFNWKKSLSISFKIFVPKTVSSNATTAGGSINLSNLSGEQNFTTSGGSLNLDQLTGNIKGRTSGGSINVSNSKNNIDLSTSGGAIYAENCDGTISLKTSGGSLDLNNLSGKIYAKTSGGSVHGNQISGELITGTSGGSIDLKKMACSLETSTSAGSIHVEMAQLGKYVKINSSVGHVDLQLPAGKGLDLDLHGSRINADVAGSFNGEKDKSRMVGKLNGGGIPITVSTSIGGINVRM